MKGHESLTTGLPGLDRVLKGLIAGDNIVWRMDYIEDYAAVALPYCVAARDSGRKLVYFRFADHEPLIPDDFGAEVYHLHPERGFESFIADVHQIIEDAGRGVFYVFDCLSDLVVDWYSDQMLGNFFMLTCPYLYDLETITYFGLLRNQHSSNATDPILQTTQLFLDIYKYSGRLYIRPLKVQYRYSPTMDMLHVWNDDEDFRPVTASSVIAEIQSGTWAGPDADLIHGLWENTFNLARQYSGLTDCDEAASKAASDIYNHVVRMVVTRDEGMLRLVLRYLTMRDVLDIRKRMIGTGLIGGKAVGMLLAKAIVRSGDPELAASFEPQDSFFIGSDVFYTFLVRNGIWWTRQKQRNRETFLDDAGLARQRILAGSFPDYVMRQFDEMLEYFGQSPIIVRSSSLLEDGFGNSFAGKYATVFCTNQGPRERRLEDFLSAVRTVYASAMSEEALRYRERRDMLDRDEQMALLVMRVSGSVYGSSFYPQVAGVGFSFNPYVWSEQIDPLAGVLRLVFGLGTRAVDRSDDDYTRIVALNAPARRPEADYEKMSFYSQRKVDYLDLTANQIVTGYFQDIAASKPDLPMEMFADCLDRGTSPVLTFKRLLMETRFVSEMRETLRLLQEAYEHPVDIEFTANFFEEDQYSINIVQCRPLPVSGIETVNLPDHKVRPEEKLFESHGAVVGQTRLVNVDRFIYIVPRVYGALAEQDRYQVARIIGKINRRISSTRDGALVLLGPGRWGTETPSLGVPVSFSEINRVSAVIELVMMHDNLIPDASLGTHFLNELVEMDMLYVALIPGQGENLVNTEAFEKAPNKLNECLPGIGSWHEVVRVVEAADLCEPGETVLLAANALSQTAICYRRTLD